MKINDTLCGFTVKRSNPIPELRGTMYEMEHIKTGARLAYLDRKDSNMTFAISFATPPEDDTGVFHIIEHSVLCGSDKYPLRDPFAELLKGSLNTFLNALTYEDRTVYPVSSRCERDFLNLVDVYLDATLCPKLKENPNIFRQEGWHYEYDGQRLTRSGVVYNEMKGAYSSPDDLAMAELNRALFEGSCYGKDSGGDPGAIPTLTYERVLHFHNKYYSPSNAQIFLDGSLDLEKTLSLIDSHISKHERKNIKVRYPKSTPVIAEPKTVKYEISETDDPKNRARVLLGYVFSDYSDSNGLLATTLLSDYLCGSNASPLKRALLEADLCRDVAMYTNRTNEQTVVIEIRDTSEENISKIISLVEKCIRQLAKDGLDKEHLAAALDNVEFKLRERDYGAFPTGVAFALSAFGTWLYGGRPEDSLFYEEKISSVREKLDSDYFEQTLLKMTVDNPHRATLIMLPDPALSDLRAKEEERELEAILSAMSDEDIQKIKDDHASLKNWQEREEDDEAKATIPTLTISDIPSKTETPPTVSYSSGESRIIHHDADTDGIVYVNLFFDASDIKTDELWKLSILASLLTNLNTETGDALSLQNKMKANLGNMTVSTAITTKNGETTPYLRLSASALVSKNEKLVDILREVLLTSDFNNPKEIENTVAQSKSAYEDAVLSSGHSIALGRIEAYFTLRGTFMEHMSGYEAYKKYKELDGNRKLLAPLSEELDELLKMLAVRRRLTVTIAGEYDEQLTDSIISLFPIGDKPKRASAAPLGARREFILAPTKVAYAAEGAYLEEIKDTIGAMRVVRSILSYEYLWNTVRMAGGAYGAGFIPRRQGYAGFYTYRDPSPARSLGCFADSAEYLRTLANSGADLTKFIIGAMGEYDILTTPASAAAMAIWNYMNGLTKEDEAKERAALIGTSPSDLLRIADIIDRITEKGSVCIVGGKEHLNTCKDNIDSVLNL